MHGISDNNLIRAAYMQGLRDGRDMLVKELRELVGSDPSVMFFTLENDVPQRLMTITELGLSGPAHDALVAKGFIFVCELIAMTEREFVARLNPSPTRLVEYESALQKKKLAFRDAS